MYSGEFLLEVCVERTFYKYETLLNERDLRQLSNKHDPDLFFFCFFQYNVLC